MTSLLLLTQVHLTNPRRVGCNSTSCMNFALCPRWTVPALKLSHYLYAPWCWNTYHLPQQNHPVYVRKYTSTMEHMGYTQIISTHKFSDQTYGKFAVILLSFLKQTASASILKQNRQLPARYGKQGNLMSKKKRNGCRNQPDFKSSKQSSEMQTQEQTRNSSEIRASGTTVTQTHNPQEKVNWKVDHM